MEPKEKYNVIDVLKFICSLLVIVLHTNPFPAYEHIIIPITHVAVPFFFICQGYFLSERTKEQTKYDSKLSVYRYCKRIIIMYFSWLVITLPITLYTRSFFSKGLIKGFLFFFRELIFHSTWRSSWYLTASVVGILVNFVLLEKFNIDKKLYLCFMILVFIICVLGSSYSNIFSRFSTGYSFYEVYCKIFTVPFTSWPIGIFWIYIGQRISNSNIIKKEINKCYLYIAFICSFLILIAEGIFVYYYSLFINTDDVYFSLIFVAPLLFIVVAKNKHNLKNCVFLRKMSTLTYCIQGSVVELLGKGRTSFFYTICICWGGAVLIIIFSRKWKKLKWLGM